jgi:hypothetical protein
MNPTSIQRATSAAWASSTRSKKREVGVLAARGVRVMAGDRVVGQAAQQVGVAGGRRVLERADAQVARRDAGEHGAGEQRLARDRVAGRTTASARVVGIPSACIASPTTCSRASGRRRPCRRRRARTACGPSP